MEEGQLAQLKRGLSLVEGHGAALETRGNNRPPGESTVIDARTDRAAVEEWLFDPSRSRLTYENYRREVDRLLLWCAADRHKPLSSLTKRDVDDYRLFLANPQPAALWIDAKRNRAGVDSPDWRPFAGPLKPKSVKTAMAIVGSLFSFLHKAGYLRANPVALSRPKKDYDLPVTRYLPPTAWRHVQQTVLSMPLRTQRDVITAARTRWIFSLLYLCGLRVSEMCSLSMGNFVMREGHGGAVRWWIAVLGKGNKPRLVPATPELMEELALYRRVLGLAPVPSASESIPAVMAANKNRTPIKRQAAHLVVKGVMEATAKRLLATGSAGDADMANYIAQASCHWLRHTAASALANSRAGIVVARDNLGHANITTSSTYLHGHDDARHDATADGHPAGWDSQRP